jgi:hypothetical protein
LPLAYPPFFIQIYCIGIMEHTRTDLEMSFGAIVCGVVSHLGGEIAGRASRTRSR